MVTADNVVLATGAFGNQNIPKISLDINKNIFQIHSSEYKNFSQLPNGGVMVVGSGQSGAQIAEDLLINGMDVNLAISKCGRRLRSYRKKILHGGIIKWDCLIKQLMMFPLRIGGNVALILQVQMVDMKLI